MAGIELSAPGEAGRAHGRDGAVGEAEGGVGDRRREELSCRRGGNPGGRMAGSELSAPGDTGAGTQQELSSRREEGWAGGMRGGALTGRWRWASGSGGGSRARG